MKNLCLEASKIPMGKGLKLGLLRGWWKSATASGDAFSLSLFLPVCSSELCPCLLYI